MNDNKRKLYDALSQDYDLGTFEQFESDIADAGKRRKLYDATIEEYDFGDFAEFENQLGFAPQAQSAPQAVAAPQPAPQLEADKSAYTFTAEELRLPDNTFRSESTSVAKLPEIKPLGVQRQIDLINADITEDKRREVETRAARDANNVQSAYARLPKGYRVKKRVEKKINGVGLGKYEWIEDTEATIEQKRQAISDYNNRELVEDWMPEEDEIIDYEP